MPVVSTSCRARSFVALAGRAEDGARIRPAARERCDLRGRGVDAVEGDQREVDLARGSVATAVELAA